MLTPKDSFLGCNYSHAHSPTLLCTIETLIIDSCNRKVKNYQMSHFRLILHGKCILFQFCQMFCQRVIPCLQVSPIQIKFFSVFYNFGFSFYYCSFNRFSFLTAAKRHLTQHLKFANSQSIEPIDVFCPSLRQKSIVTI